MASTQASTEAENGVTLLTRERIAEKWRDAGLVTI